MVKLETQAELEALAADDGTTIRVGGNLDAVYELRKASAAVVSAPTILQASPKNGADARWHRITAPEAATTTDPGGGGGGGGLSSTFIFDVSTGAVEDTALNTYTSWANLMAATASLRAAKIPITIGVRADLDQVNPTTDIAIPAGNYDLESVSFEGVRKSDGSLANARLDFAAETTLPRLFSGLKNISARFNNAVAPVYTLADLERIYINIGGPDSFVAQLHNAGSQPILRIPASLNTGLTFVRVSMQGNGGNLSSGLSFFATPPASELFDVNSDVIQFLAKYKSNVADDVFRGSGTITVRKYGAGNTVSTTQTNLALDGGTLTVVDEQYTAAP